MQENTEDLGFGSRVAQDERFRLLNQNGSFNVRRRGLSFLDRLSPYHSLITSPWWVFHLFVSSFFLCFNLLFAIAYLLCGNGALRGLEGTAFADRLAGAFFFSVHTSTTIGYGNIVPITLAANVLSSLEVVAGLLAFALATGIMFARVSRPSAQLLFSKNAVVAPYRGGSGLMLRIANRRRHELLEVTAHVILSRFEGEGHARRRNFHQLGLERQRVMFFPLHWTIVHPIDANSPLSGLTREQFLDSDPEVFVLLSAIDETFSHAVHARTSYREEEVIWGARFSDMFQTSSGKKVSVDLRRIDATEPAVLPL